MNVEQRLLDAFDGAEWAEPSPDLFTRILHSIEEDRLHRRRVVLTAVTLVLTVCGVVGAMAVALSDGPLGTRVPWKTMEVIETFVVVVAVAVLGPAIRRFGRNYVADLWPEGSVTPPALLRLLDLAYALVLIGFVLVTVRLGEPAVADQVLAEQLRQLTNRLGGVLLIVGLLHATTIASLPLVALVANSTRTGRPLPRWVVGLLVLIGAGIGLNLIQLIAGLLATGLS